MELTRDAALDNAIVSSTRNPWHCFFFKLSSKAVAKTFVNSNRFYSLPTRREYRASVHVHELAHISSCLGLPQNAFCIVTSMLNEFGLPESRRDLDYADLLFVYNNEITEMLEALAYHLQLASEATSTDLREGVAASLGSHYPSRLALTLQIRDTALRFLARKASRRDKNDLWRISTALIQFSCATRNWVRQRAFDRFRSLRNLSEEEIPKWKHAEEAYETMGRVLRSEGYEVVEMRRPALALNNARLWNWVKVTVRKMRSAAYLRPFVMGLLKELDASVGPISYTTNSLEDLAQSRIEACYLCANAIDRGFNAVLKRRLTDIALLLRSGPVRKSKEKNELLVGYRKALEQLAVIKKTGAGSCRGPHVCIGQAACHLDLQLSDAVVSTWFGAASD